MRHGISRNNSRFDQVVKFLLGLALPLSWPAFLWITMTQRGDSRANLMQSWQNYALYSFLGAILWFFLNKFPRVLKNIMLVGAPLLSVVLIYFSVAAYASRGESLYIGNLFFKSAGLAGNVIFILSIISLLFLSGPLRSIPYSTPLLVFLPYLMSYIPGYSASFWKNVFMWILILGGTIGYLNLLGDLLFYLRWEILDSGERHA